MSEKTLVILSGGLDSTTCLYHHLQFGQVLAVTFDYGQRHWREIEYARSIAADVNVRHFVLSVPIYKWTTSALLGHQDIPHGHYSDDSMRQTVVPYRNLILLSVAASIAANELCDTVSYGAHAGDAAIYPDCRPAFVTALTHTLYSGDYSKLKLVAPLIGMTKRQVAEYAKQLGVPIDKTWSCYEGGDEPCGKCGACVARAEALA